MFEDFKENEIFLPTQSILALSLSLSLHLHPPASIHLSLFTRFIAAKVANSFGIKDRVKSPPDANPILLAAYRKSPKRVPKHVLVDQAALGEEYIQRWWRKQRSYDSPTKFVKFKESFWRFFFYLSTLVYGLWCLWDKPWLWDTELYWVSVCE